MRAMNRYAVPLFGIGLALFFGVMFTIFIWGDVLDYYQSQNWHQAEGEVIRSSVQSSSGDEGTVYLPAVEYFYYVGDQRLTHNRLRFDGEVYTSNYKGARETVERYPSGQSIRVYYDPQNPQNAVIEREIGGGMMAFLVVGGVALLIALLIFLFGILLPLLRSLWSRLTQS